MKKEYDVKLTFIEPILGTVPKDKEVYASFIKTKGPTGNDDEMESVEETEEKGWTGFHMVDGSPVLYNYVIKGFFKDACGMLRRVTGTQSKKVKSYKKVIDGLCFVYPRRIPIFLPGYDVGSAAELEVLERPLRAETAKGPRVTVTRSDMCPIGSSITFTVKILGGISKALFLEWLDYGKERGLGQWRNGGYGSFEYEIVKVR
jgi:hypothetical protein